MGPVEPGRRTAVRPAGQWGTARQLALSAATTLLAVAALPGCGNESRSSDAPAAVFTQPGGPGRHIHGVLPQGPNVLVATHDGLWEAKPGDSRARRVGESRPDIMGMAAAAPQRLVGSGHPQLDEDLPPLLGLVESRDGGRSWDSVSLLGRADFHALTASDDRVYGFDETGGAFLMSVDGGRRWSRRSSPGPGIVSLAVAPTDPDMVLATTERGLKKSTDAARTWAATGSERPLMITWPSAHRLFSVAADGATRRSGDAGRTWRGAGGVSGMPVALAADDARLVVALADGRVMQSRDDGSTWVPLVTLR